MSPKFDLVNNQDIFNLELKLVEKGEDPTLVQKLIQLLSLTKDQSLDTEEEWSQFIEVWDQA